MRCRLAAASDPSALTHGTRFSWTDGPAGGIAVTCPWGNTFELRPAASAAAGRDPRGEQPGLQSVPQGIPELRIYVDAAADLEGVARFYTELFGAAVTQRGDSVAVACGPLQELVFTRRPVGVPTTASDYHVSMYVDDFEGIFRSRTLGSQKIPCRQAARRQFRRRRRNEETLGAAACLLAFGKARGNTDAGGFRRTEALGLVFVNPRFKVPANPPPLFMAFVPGLNP